MPDRTQPVLFNPRSLSLEKDWRVTCTLEGRVRGLDDLVRRLAAVDRAWVLAAVVSSMDQDFVLPSIYRSAATKRRGVTTRGVFGYQVGGGGGPPDPTRRIHSDQRLDRLRFPRPRGVQVVKQSPPWLELAGQIALPASVSASSVSFLVWCLKHPSEMAGFFPTLVETWHVRWMGAERAKEEREALAMQRMAGLATKGDESPDQVLIRESKELQRKLTAAKPTDVEAAGVPEFDPTILS